ncbi:MAG: ribonuclease Y [Myxococcota bacterium]
MTMFFFALPVGFLLGILVLVFQRRLAGQTHRSQIEQMQREAQLEQERLLQGAKLEAQERMLELQREHEQNERRHKDELSRLEKHLRQKQGEIERKSEALDEQERQLRETEQALELQESKLRGLYEEQRVKLKEAEFALERVGELTRDEARQQLIASVTDIAKKTAAAQIKVIEEDATREADQRAKQIIGGAIQRLAGEFVSEKTVSIVELPSDDMKGRIIGREGRNIRALEQATGVDVVIDDTPEAVILSAFNPVRREIAKLALERLIADGRVHPARIEEVVEKVKEEMDEVLLKHGEQAVFDLGLHTFHPELVKLVGRLKYRVINGQNVWNHAVETAYIAGMMAAELGVNARLAKRAGLLHDIGKAVDHEVEGHHAEIGAEQARRFGEKQDVVLAIRHHHEKNPPTLMGALLQAADVLSKARPGARRDVLDSYVKRLEDLERTAKSFAGVEEAFASQSGREIRVMVDYAKLSDQESLLLSADIAARIESELTYPGEVRVTVIREARATEIAR